MSRDSFSASTRRLRRRRSPLARSHLPLSHLPKPFVRSSTLLPGFPSTDTSGLLTSSQSLTESVSFPLDGRFGPRSDGVELPFDGSTLDFSQTEVENLFRWSFTSATSFNCQTGGETCTSQVPSFVGLLAPPSPWKGAFVTADPILGRVDLLTANLGALEHPPMKFHVLRLKGNVHFLVTPLPAGLSLVFSDETKTISFPIITPNH